MDSIMMPTRSRLATASPVDTISNYNSKPRPNKHSISPPRSDRIDRTSFSSIHENNSGVQSFTDSKTSSYLRHEFERRGSEEAIEDFTPTKEIEDPMTMLHPESALHGAGMVCPCTGFRGWKTISIGGKIASKSFGDLRRAAGWDWEEKTASESGKERVNVNVNAKGKGKDGNYAAGKSPFERLPTELLGTIIDQLATDIPPNGFTARNIDLMSLLLTSRAIHSATLATLYSHITFPHSRIFAKFLRHVTEYPSLGTIVRRLDFSHFNPTGAGISRRERQQTQNLIPATLLQCLNLTPNLREFLAQEHIDDDLSPDVIRKLFCGLPKLRSLDFCACSSTAFKEAMGEILVNTPLPAVLPITRLSLHECTILPASTYLTILPKLAQLTHLDVAHTRITDSALASIPQTAKLTHLNLSKCSSLTGAAVANFLINHPAAQTLIYINLSMDSKSAELLSAENLSSLLPALQGRTALRSLNLKGSKMISSHIDTLIPLTKHLEELGVGRHLHLSDIERIFSPDPSGVATWIPHSLRYIDVSDLSVAELDLSTLFSFSPILKNLSSPLEVLELSTEVNIKLSKSGTVVKRVGWVLKELGRRYWLVRDVKDGDSGARSWKSGANYWGMRKVPVVWAEVGGMYGHYMFKR